MNKENEVDLRAADTITEQDLLSLIYYGRPVEAYLELLNQKGEDDGCTKECSKRTKKRD